MNGTDTFSREPLVRLTAVPRLLPATRLRLCLITVFVLSLPACSGVDDIVGASCSGDADCTGIPGTGGQRGYCTWAFVCTAPCNSHTDCGCAEETSNKDIRNGNCAASCVKIRYKDKPSQKRCFRVCEGDEDCEGGLVCHAFADDGKNCVPLEWTK